MRANEILTESAEELNEAPVGALSRLFTNIGAKMGLSGQQIQKQFNDEMMQIRKEIGPLMRQADGVNADEYVDFMTSKGLGNAAREAVSKVIKGRGKNVRTRKLDPTSIDELIKYTVSRAYLKHGGGRFSRYGSEDDEKAQFMRSPSSQKQDDGKAQFMRSSSNQKQEEPVFTSRNSSRQKQEEPVFTSRNSSRQKQEEPSQQGSSSEVLPKRPRLGGVTKEKGFTGAKATRNEKMKEFADFFRAMSPEEKKQFQKMMNS